MTGAAQRAGLRRGAAVPGEAAGAERQGKSNHKALVAPRDSFLRRLIKAVDSHEFSNVRSAPGIPSPEELAALRDEDVGSILVRAARDMRGAAVRDLERLATGGDPRIALAAVRALGEIRERAAAEALVRIRDGAEGKGVRKEAGRSLQRLKSAGVNPAAAHRSAAGRAPLVSVPAGKVESAFAGYYDRKGTRLLVTQVWAPARGWSLIAWVLNEDVGVDSCRVSHGSKRGLREWAASYAEEMRLVGIDVDHARFILNEAVDARRRIGREVPQGYAIYAGAVKNMNPAPVRPIVYEKLNAERTRQNGSALGASWRLLSLAFACPWDLGEDATGPFREKVIAVATGVIRTSKAVRGERLRAIVEDAIEVLFTPDVAQKYRRRLEETAYLLLLEGRRGPAEAALAAALAIADGRPLRDIPFVRALVERSIGVVRRGTREAETLRTSMAEQERVRLVRPAFESVGDERVMGGAPVEADEGGFRTELDPEWGEGARDPGDDEWREDAAGTDAGREDRDGGGRAAHERPSIIIDPRTERP